MCSAVREDSLDHRPKPGGASSVVPEAMPTPTEASAHPLHPHSDQDTQSPRKGSGRPRGPGQEWAELRADRAADEKLLPRLDEEARREAARRESWWETWLEVSRGRGGQLPGSRALLCVPVQVQGQAGLQPAPS